MLLGPRQQRQADVDFAISDADVPDQVHFHEAPHYAGYYYGIKLLHYIFTCWQCISSKIDSTLFSDLVQALHEVG